ncbi:MAG: DNA replication and repair protein RecF [Chitinophagaceae bacterium]|nr:DNA replication and repair protein RecF [Chitinophagaceae bacterium]
MAFLSRIALYQFRNYTQSEFQFDRRVVCITGQNGAGKTSLLDAIHYLCFTKSYLHHNDLLSVQHEKQGMRISGDIDEAKLACILRENGKKEFILNGEAYTQFSKHIGLYPCVFISPDDTVLITEGAEHRRKFMDVLLSQLDPNYMQALIRYNKILQQRNAFLKRQDETAMQDLSLLSIYDTQLDEQSRIIYPKRKALALSLEQLVTNIYHALSGGREQIGLRYESRLEQDSLLELLTHNRSKDLASQRTNYGIHKDELSFTLNGMPFKQTASQGQRKSLLFGLKLAQFEWIRQGNGKHAFLLLDDIFEKLDQARSEALIEYIGQCGAQVFITDTHADRVRQAFEGKAKEVQYIEL